jgi:hypothetical protein
VEIEFCRVGPVGMVFFLVGSVPPWTWKGRNGFEILFYIFLVLLLL